MSKIRDIPRAIKRAFQRVYRGYDYLDTYDIRYFMQSTMVKMLKDFESQLVGSPMDIEKDAVDIINNLDVRWVSTTYEDIIQSMKKFWWFKDSTEDDLREDGIYDGYIVWRLILRRIIYCLEQSNEDKCSEENEYAEEYNKLTFDSYPELSLEDRLNKRGEMFETKEYKELQDKWLDRCKEIDEYMDDMKTEAMTLFNTYFFALWD